MEVGRYFRMTYKTRLFLWIYRRFDYIGKIGQWFIKHCDTYPEGYSPFKEVNGK